MTTCVACLSSAAGCAAHRPHVSAVDLMGRRIGILVERAWSVTVETIGGQAFATVWRVSDATTTEAPTLPEAVALAWEWACERDPLLAGLGLVLAAAP